MNMAMVNTPLERERKIESKSNVFDVPKRFSESKIWQLQREYYETQGMDAWHSGAVPHYVSTNPTLAWQYAQIVWAMLQDWQTKQHQAGETAQGEMEPFTVLELGTGHGRFTFHFLTALQKLAGMPIEELPFRYIQSDLADGNIEFWLQHPQLQDWRNSGVLWAAKLDVTEPLSEIKDVQTGKCLNLNTFNSPIVVVANYIFDSLPGDVFYFNDGNIYETLLSLHGPQTATMEDLYDVLQPRWSHQPWNAENHLGQPYLPTLLEEYQKASDAYVSVPTAAIKFVSQLNQFSNFPCLLLAGDKGPRNFYQTLSDSPPYIASHGSISVSVNFHLLSEYVLQQENSAIFQSPHEPLGFTLMGFMLNGAQYSWFELENVYEGQVGHYNADEFFVLKKCLERNVDSLGVNEILAWLRQSHYDANIFALCAQRLATLVKSEGFFQSEDVALALLQVWQHYFQLGSGVDVAGLIALVFYHLQFFEMALEFVDFSLAQEEDNVQGLYLGMLCCFELRAFENAQTFCLRVRGLDEGFLEIGSWVRRLGVSESNL